MARSDWTALCTEPAAEYRALTELERLGLAPYMPQLKRRQLVDGRYVLRRFPLFPRYLLIRIDHARHPSIRLARGINKTQPTLSDPEGRLWRAPERVIDAIRTAEQRGDFDEILHKQDPTTLNYGVLATIRATLSDDGAELLTPLFGGVRIRASLTEPKSPA
jgi:hypothetical protein